MQFNAKQQQLKHQVEKFMLSFERVQIYINLLFMFVAPFYSQLTHHPDNPHGSCIQQNAIHKARNEM
jgi:hypothetical protein